MTNHPNRSRRPTIVTMLRHYSGFANVDDRFEPCPPGWDGAVDELRAARVLYVLPAGYEVAESTIGEWLIYDPEGCACEIIQHRSGGPQLIGRSPDKAPVLALAEDRYGDPLPAAVTGAV